MFRLGREQGLFCLGCCGAMMAVVFAVGMMNVVWMAVLSAIMTDGKMFPGYHVGHAVGVALTVAGVALVAASCAAHWPIHRI